MCKTIIFSRANKEAFLLCHLGSQFPHIQNNICTSHHEEKGIAQFKKEMNKLLHLQLVDKLLINFPMDIKKFPILTNSLFSCFIRSVNQINVDNLDQKRRIIREEQASSDLNTMVLRNV